MQLTNSFHLPNVPGNGMTYVGELEADCADKGIAQPIAAAIRREIADRLKSLMEGKP